MQAVVATYLNKRPGLGSLFLSEICSLGGRDTSTGVDDRRPARAGDEATLQEQIEILAAKAFNASENMVIKCLLRQHYNLCCNQELEARC